MADAGGDVEGGEVTVQAARIVTPGIAVVDGTVEKAPSGASGEGEAQDDMAMASRSNRGSGHRPMDVKPSREGKASLRIEHRLIRANSGPG
jgi:hypothetical protein